MEIIWNIYIYEAYVPRVPWRKMKEQAKKRMDENLIEEEAMVDWV